MSLSFLVIPGKVFAEGEQITYAKLNTLGAPSIEVLDDSLTVIVADLSVTTIKLADGVLSADAAGRAKMANNYLTAEKLEETARHDVAQYAAGTYAAGVYTVDLTPDPAAYTAGMVVRFKADTANTATGAVDLHLTGCTGNKNLFKNVTTELAAGDIPLNAVVTAIYDGTNFQVAEIFGANRYSAVAGATLANGVLTFAHGLGVTPALVRSVLICTTNQAPFVVDDEIDCGIVLDNGGATNYISTYANATNIKVTILDTGLRVVTNTGTYTTLTPASWKVKVYARI